MIDCDVHNTWTSAEVLLPYLDPYFRDYLERGEVPGPRGAFPCGWRPWLHPETGARRDAYPPDGGAPGSSIELVRTQLLDRYGVEYAILTGGDAIEVSTLANHHYATALARAYNDWMIDNWLSQDSRLKGSVLVAPQDPLAAAAEIRRVGGHPDIVQVLLSSHSQRPYGNPFHLPIWEAAAELDLPVAIHFGGTGGINVSPFACGMPTFYYEYHALVCEAAMTHLASVICQGVFVKFPNVSFVIVECGVAWLPGLLWRLDANYRALRKETPWLKMLPSEYARQHVRLTTQPLEQAGDRTKLWNVLEAFDGEHVLMFASDYPHWDFDDPTMVEIPPAWRENVMDRNARELYGLRSRQELEPAGSS